MFLFSVTRQSIARRIDAPSVREFPVKGWVVTVATDEWLSSCHAEADAVTAIEALPSAPGLEFAQAAFSARDQSIGISKALVGGRQVFYHAAVDGGFHCASHVRLLRAAGVPLVEDPERLPELFVYLYVTAPQTLFKGISQLLAGQRLQFEFDGAAWRMKATERYTPPPPDRAVGANGGGGVAAYGARTRDALRDAVLALAPANQPPHVLLSGGLDSSILFKLAHDDLGVRESFSTGYPFESEAEDVEKRYALTAAEALGSRHRFAAPTTVQFLRGVLESVSVAEQPVILLQSVLLLLLFRDGMPAGRGTAILGQGADGVFGLRAHRMVGRVDRFKESHPRLALAFHPALWSALRPVLSLSPVRGAVWKGFQRLRRDPSVIDILDKRWGPGVDMRDERHVLWRLGVTADEDWVRGRFHAIHDKVIANRAGTLEPFADRSTLDTLSLLDFLSDVAATQGVWSKLGESAGKAVYYPFNSRAILDAAFATPWDVKLAEPKGLLRDVARKIGVPEFIITRPKAGFVVGPSRWALRDAAFEPLVPLAAKVWGEAELRRMQSSTWNTAFTFWTMINYAIWRRLFIDGEPLDTLMGELERSMGQTRRSGGEAREAFEPVPAAI